MNDDDTLPLTTNNNKSNKPKTITHHHHHYRTIWQSISIMIRSNSINNPKKSLVGLLVCFMMTIFLIVVLPTTSAEEPPKVRVDIIATNPDGLQVTKEYKYSSHVTLYVEDLVNGEKTPSGWSTRKEDGAAVDKPFEFEPGVGLIQGWTDGVLQMKEGGTY